MDSNGDGTYLGGWGMSIASQRAKERENRTPDVEVMMKMVKLGMLNLAWAVVPLGWAVVPLVVLSGSTAWMGGSTGRDGILCRLNRGAILGWKLMISGAKIGEILWMGSGETWGKARST